MKGKQTPMTKLRVAAFLLSATVLLGSTAHTNAAVLRLRVVAQKKVVTKSSVGVKKVTPPKLVPRRIDGVMVKPSQANLWPVAAMIDNFPTARPQASLARASVVYEALAEGGIPRFMAVFAERDMLLVGPIRSTRPYFVRYATEYTAAMIHAGGSVDALTMLKYSHLLNMEGVKGKTAKYFFRTTKIYQNVHDLFTTGKNINAFLATTNAPKLSPNYRPWHFTDDATLAKRGKGKSGATVNLGAGKSYLIRYEYNRKDNTYLRSTGGKAHLDRVTKQQIAVKNVVLLIVPKEKVLDRKGRLNIEVNGTGKGVLLQNGKAITITWQKRIDRDRTIFRTVKGQEISLVRGSTWITVVPKGHSFSIF